MKQLIPVSAYVALVESCIDLSGYAAGAADKLLKAERRKIIKSIFSSEFCYAANIQKYGAGYNLAKEYLQGLPSCCTVPFSNFDIIQWAEKQLERELSEAEAEALLCDNSGYWYQCGKAFMLILSNKA